MTPDDVTPDEHRPTMDDEYPSGYPRAFWAGLLVGWAVIAIGIRGLLVNEDARMGTNPGGWVVLLVQSNLAHDLVLVPAVLLVGVLVARFVPAGVRAPVQGGLIVTGVIVLFAFPFVRGYGIKPDNPTILPQDYGRGLLIVLGVVWAVTAAVTIGRRRSHRVSGAAPAEG
ncbi:MAG: hypothetical protein M3503_02785 [Actinomycetota bacterium]|nr:hypothetical protein [Actinomycetota bacterium]